MAEITGTFRNTCGASRRWVIFDLDRDPNSPPIVFNDFLDADQSTDPLTLHSGDGLFGRIQYQRSDGAPQMADVGNNDEIRMQ